MATSPFVIIGILLGIMLDVREVKVDDVFVVSWRGKAVVLTDYIDIHLLSS